MRAREAAARLAGPAAIVLAAAAAVAPQYLRGNSCGHDFDFHLLSWLDAQRSWRAGIPYPHWTPSANYGAGEPRFIFYPPLTWMLGAALGFAMAWFYVPMALTFLLLAGTGLAVRALAKLYLSEAAATLAGCAALFSGYALFTAYERSAFGELAGGIWIPLILLFLLRERARAGSAWRRAFDGSAAPLAVAMALAWLSNAPVGVMACYLLAFAAMLMAALRRTWAPVLRAAVAGAIGLMLASVYLVPAAWEQRWVEIRQVTQDPGEMIENSWLLARHATPALELHDIELMRVSAIALTMLAVAVAAALLLWKAGKLNRRWTPMLLIPAVVLFLMLPVSLPVWNALPKLRFLQFPWRWLLAVEAPMAILFAGAVWPARRWRQVAAGIVGAAVFAAAAAGAGFFFFQMCDEEDAVAGMLDVYRSGAGFEGSYEYETTGSDNSQLATNLPAACLVANPRTQLGVGAAGIVPAWDASQKSCEQTYSFAANGPERFRVTANLAHAEYLVLRLRNYPAWTIAVNGEPTQPVAGRVDGLIAVPAPKGPVEVSVHWSDTPDTRVGRWLTALGVALLTALCAMERRQAAARVS